MTGLLHQPLATGRVRLRNRVVFGAHLTNQAVDGLPTAQHAAYYAARAAGGAALLITEELAVHPADRAYEKVIRGHDPACLPGLRAIADAVHAHGAVVLAQLTHHGGQADGTYTRRPVVAPSPIPDPLFREVPVALAPGDVDALVAAFADVAGRAVAAGLDGVEVQASQASLLRQLLSPATNRRTDVHGGAIANRARLLRAVLAAVREAIGPDRLLSVRLAGQEDVPDGTTPADAIAVARLLAADGHVDLLHTAVGVATATLDRVIPSMRTPAGYAEHVSAAIRGAVDLPVIGVGRFTEPAQAERALADGSCDLVSMVRAQIADPDLVRRAAARQPIRTCLGCNQECVGRTGRNRWLGCLHNPRAGREATPAPAPARPGRRVVVVGGGPGGMQAAITAAERGHHVTLLERDDDLGGQVALAAALPGREGFGVLARDLAHRVRALGIAVHLGVEADAGTLVDQRPDAVVLATGSRPAAPSWAHPTAPAGSAPRVVDVRDVLTGSAAPTGRVLVVDEVGGHHAPGVAELLAARGCQVTVCTAAMVVAQDLATTLDDRAWARTAERLGIAQVPDVLVTAVREGQVDLLHHPTGSTTCLAVDAVVAAAQPAPADDLWTALHVDGPPPFRVERIGDCLAPRRAHAAIIEGERIGAIL